MAEVTYDKQLTALLVIDPYNDVTESNACADLFGQSDFHLAERMEEKTWQLRFWSPARRAASAR